MIIVSAAVESSVSAALLAAEKAFVVQDVSRRRVFELKRNESKLFSTPQLV